MAKEKTLILVKPAHVHLADKLLAELDKYGKRIMQKKIDKTSLKIWKKHYSQHEGKDFFENAVNYFAGKSVIMAIYEGEDIINKIRNILGNMDPSKAHKGSIRARYCSDSKAKADIEKRAIENALHVSGTIEEAEREIKVWTSSES